MSAEKNKAIARRIFQEVQSDLRTDVIDDYYAPKYVCHYTGGYRGPQTLDLAGLKEQKANLRDSHTAHAVIVEDAIAEGDKVAVRWSSVGTLTERVVERGAPPSFIGKQTTNSGTAIMRFEGDKVAEEWWVMDGLGMFQRLGAELVLPAE
jgi:hypothetical protein